MKFLLITALLISTECCNDQSTCLSLTQDQKESSDRAYYLTNLNQKDLVLADAKTGNIQMSYAFTDSVELNPNPAQIEMTTENTWITQWINRGNLNHMHDSIISIVDLWHTQDRIFNSLDSNKNPTKRLDGFFDVADGSNTFPYGHNTFKFDSLYVENRWYQTVTHSYNDGFIGGSGPEEKKTVLVSGIGVIYDSYTSGQHPPITRIMLCHEDTTKNRVLNQIGIQSRLPLKSSKSPYGFDNCVSRLIDNWQSYMNDLILLDSRNVKDRGEIKYSVQIKNISNRRYYLRYGVKIGPTTKKYKINGKDIEENLLKEHRGKFIKRINEAIYIEPGDSISFDQIIPIDLYTETEVNYTGFQLYNYGYNLLNWFTKGIVEHNGETYIVYPFREINRFNQ